LDYGVHPTQDGAKAYTAPASGTSQETADVCPNAPEQRAKELLQQHLELEQKLAGTRAWYLNSPAKPLRWAQLGNRRDLGLRFQVSVGNFFAAVGRICASRIEAEQE
jgi:hypothetical protein